MRWLDGYLREVPVPVRVRSPHPASEVVEAVGAAVAREHLASVPGGARAVYRLRGTVTGPTVSLRVSYSGPHMGEWPFYSVTGEVHDAGTGSEFRGRMILPGAASRTWLLVFAAVPIIGVLLLVAGFPWVLPVSLLGFVLLPFGPEIRRRNACRVARDVEAILASIIDLQVPAESSPAGIRA